MQYSKKIYIEKEFLKIICEEADNASHIVYEKQKICHAIYNLLFYETVEVHIDMSEENMDVEYKRASKIVCKSCMENIQCPLYERLIYKLHDAMIYDQEHIQLYFSNPVLTSNAEDLDKEGLYLTMLDEETCRKLSEKSGAIIISPDNIDQFLPLTNDDGINIPKSIKSDWKEIFSQCGLSEWRRKIPCNFIAIVDNYILNDTKTIEKNLKPILDSIMPDHYLNEPFQIKIISVFNNLPFENRWQIVEHIIKAINRPYAVKLSIFKCVDKPFHDRTILTDNVWISCGAGFDLFNNKGKTGKETIVNIISPFLNDRVLWGFKAYANLIDSINKTEMNLPDYDDLEKEVSNVDSYPFKKERIIQCQN